MSKLIDITGKKFGKLTAVQYRGKGKWDCRCECGNWTLSTVTRLMKGETYSCGCYRKRHSEKTLPCGEECFTCPYDDCIF